MAARRGAGVLLEMVPYNIDWLEKQSQHSGKALHSGAWKKVMTEVISSSKHIIGLETRHAKGE